MRFDFVEVFVSVSASFVNLHRQMNCDQNYHLKWLRLNHHCQIRQNLEQGYYFLKTGGYLKKWGYKMININFCFVIFHILVLCEITKNKINSGQTVYLVHQFSFIVMYLRECRQIVMNFPNPKCCHNQIKDCCHSIPPRLPILLLLLLIDTLIVMLLFLMIYGVQSKCRAGERERLDLLDHLFPKTLFINSFETGSFR